MGNSANDYIRDHWKRIQLTMNSLKIYLNESVQNVAYIGFTDFDELIVKMLTGRNISFVVPNEFKAYIKTVNKMYTFADITKDIPSALKEKFDMVIFTEVLEHIFSPDKVIMANIFLLLKPGGILCFSVPNIATFGNRVRLLFGKNVSWLKEDQVTGVFGGNGHIREYTLKEAVYLMNNFNIIRVLGISGYRTGVRKILNILPKSYQNTILVIGKKI